MLLLNYTFFKLYNFQTEINAETGAPKDNFTLNTLKWLQSIGSTSKTVSEVLETHDPFVSLLICRKY